MTNEIKELAIGEEGVIDGVKVRCVEGVGDSRDCDVCIINDICCSDSSGYHPCTNTSRDDNKNVYYQEVK